LFADKNSLYFPLLKSKYNLALNIDTLEGAIKGENLSGDLLSIRLAGSVRNLTLQNPKLTENIIRFPSVQLDGNFKVSPNSISLDSTSTMKIHQLKMHPYFKYTFAPKKIYALGFRTEKEEAQLLFDALPEGLFDSMKGIKVAGKLAYHLNFELPENNPNALTFEAGFNPEKFKVIAYGSENLSKINSSFLYTPYEYGKPMRSRIIGTANPNYASLSAVSPYLKNAVVASEDPNFYSHHGIDEYAFRKVISIDYKAKSFKRGASTISMQMVKNTFLSREKTVGRKAEEMLITWLLENAKITSKQRILEVYLNLIEWAPNVYGIGEASRFYFAKSPIDLTLGESIFLTHIIPKPKAYQYAFNIDGTLKGYIKGYYRFISGNLLNRGKITPSDTLSMFQIILKGSAAKYIIKTPDTLRQTMDSLGLDPNLPAFPMN
jgi:hypothetical protein